MKAKTGRSRILLSVTALIGVTLSAGWLFVNRKESTSKFARFHGRNIVDFLHGYAYFKWTSTYLRPVKYMLENPACFPAWLRRSAGNRLMQTHHSKVVTNDIAKRLVDIKEPVLVRNPEQVLPFEKARDIIFKNAGNIAVIDCPCRQLSENPCQPIDVCFVLGEPLVDFVLEHKPKNSRRLSAPEAVEILQREHKRGRVHTAWFKDAAGNRFYSICNCCSCCCIGLKALSCGFGVVASSGYIAVVDHDDCTLCESCVDARQFKAVTMSDEVSIDEKACKGCGVCVEICPAGAVSLREDAKKPGPLLMP